MTWKINKLKKNIPVLFNQLIKDGSYCYVGSSPMKHLYYFRFEKCLRYDFSWIRLASCTSHDRTCIFRISCTSKQCRLKGYSTHSAPQNKKRSCIFKYLWDRKEGRGGRCEITMIKQTLAVLYIYTYIQGGAKMFQILSILQKSGF